ncbi:hypothetical protein [Myroides guanonis]|uniref:Sensor of ECF-type sigma factor n=1 Tax=Myroides guanonis TaxID=1150112 RepID=A0A1I3PJ58_9FLAO|nr:hypothetical protein [Myroides guanonis]SFJ21400.1 hypothetical protein SAMN04487893_104150 [Myroides guanonis]
MKKIAYLLCSILISSFALAQDHKSHEQIKSLKIAHLASELDLTTQEADKFWPVYTTYDNKMYDLRHNDEARFIHKTDIEDIKKMSEEDAKKALANIKKYEEEYFSIRKKFNEDAQKILSNKKIILLKKAEDDFNRKLLKQYKKKK